MANRRLRFSLLNAQGLVTKRTNKLKSDYLINIFKCNDIVLFTETWADELSELDVDGFECFYLNRTKRKSSCKRSSGGIAAYVKSNLVSADTLFFRSDDDILWLKISRDKLSIAKDLYIGLCYVLPEDSSRQTIIEDNVFDRLLDSLVLTENDCNNDGYFILCGDFNSRTSILSDFVVDDTTFLVDSNILPDEYQEDAVLQRHSQDRGHTNSNGGLLLEFCKQTGLRLVNGRVGDDRNVGKYTFVNSIGSSVIDYVLCRPDLFDNVSHFCVHDPNILSDHCLIEFTVSFNSSIENVSKMCVEEETVDLIGQESSTQTNDTITCKYVWDSEKKESYLEKLDTSECKRKMIDLVDSLNDCTNGTNLDCCLESFECLFKDAANICLKNVNPISENDVERDSNKNLPWYNEECYEKKRIFYKTLNSYRELPDDENRLKMVEARSKYKALLRKCRFEYDNERTRKLVNVKRKNAREYWNMLKESAGVKSAKIPLSTFEKYFKAINNPTDHFFSPDEDVLHFIERYERDEFTIMFDELNIDISIEEIDKAIKQLKNNKSAGPDLILNEFLTNGKHILMPVLRTMFNTIFRLGYFPDRWSEGYIIPLHKKGNIDDVTNYRGITLLSCVGKLFTRVLNNRLQMWAEKYNVYIEAQAGFRTGMSTVDNIFVLNGLISSFINRKNSCSVRLLILQKLLTMLFVKMCGTN